MSDAQSEAKVNETDEVPTLRLSQLKGVKRSVPLEELRAFLDAIHEMKTYAASEGIPIPESVRKKLAGLAAAEAAIDRFDAAQQDAETGNGPSAAEGHRAVPVEPAEESRQKAYTEGAGNQQRTANLKGPDDITVKGVAVGGFEDFKQGNSDSSADTKKVNSDLEIVGAIETAITVHAALSKLVAPATPDSIRYTKPPASIGDFARRQSIVFWLTLAAIGSIVLYLSTLIAASVVSEPSKRQARVVDLASAMQVELSKLADLTDDPSHLGSAIDETLKVIETKAEAIERANRAVGDSIQPKWPQEELMESLVGVKDQPATAAASVARASSVVNRFRLSAEAKPLGAMWLNVLLQHLKNLFAAMLGAAFYTLYTANTYIVQRTFDRTYTTHYIVRFVLGVVSGVILANFGEYLITGSLATGAERPGVVLTQAVLAVLGGYSADAVNSIFTRVAETITTLVRGDPRKQSSGGDGQAADGNASVKIQDALSKEISARQKLLKQAIQLGAHDELQASIQQGIDELIRRANGEGD